MDQNATRDTQAQLQALDAKIDALTEQMATLTDYVIEQRQRQQEIEQQFA